MTATIFPKAVPTGGVITLNFQGDDGNTTVEGNCVLSRAVSGVSGVGAFTPIYSGGPLMFYVDAGDMLPTPLLNGTPYVYKLVDDNGTVQTAAITPGNTVAVIPDGMTSLVIRMIQAMLNGMPALPGISVPTVQHAMPLGNFPPLPFIVVNQDLIQQEHVPIGQQVENPDENNTWTIGGSATRIWRVSIFSRNAVERDYFRDAIIGWFKIALAYVFAPLGRDFSHRFQAVSETVTSDFEGLTPGFQSADIMLEVTGVYDAALVTGYGSIQGITSTVTYPDEVSDQTHVPTGS